ncbi:8839_t:CDS:2, partial [Ambispora leptoticha]
SKQCNAKTELSRKPTRIQRIKRKLTMTKSHNKLHETHDKNITEENDISQHHSAECLAAQSHEHNSQAESSKTEFQSSASETTHCICRKSSSSSRKSKFFGVFHPPSSQTLSSITNDDSSSSPSTTTNITDSNTDLPTPKDDERKNIVRRSWSQMEVRHLRHLFDIRRVYWREIRRRNSYAYTNSQLAKEQLAAESEIRASNRALNSRGGDDDSVLDYIFGDIEDDVDSLAAGQDFVSRPPLDLFEFQAQVQKATDVTSRSQQMRRFKAFEIYSSEHSYLNHLRTLKKLFMDPCYQAAKKPNQTMNPADVKVMYAHIIDLIKLSSKLVHSLAQIQPWLNVECRVGEVFLKYSKEFEVYQRYAENHLDSRAAVKRADQKILYRKFIQESQRSKDQYRLDLSGYLIMPIQRISRYRLLLQELMNHTPEFHPDFEGLSRALKDMTARVDECNSIANLLSEKG